MIYLYLVGIAHKWMGRHKLRYLLSWISFALVSIVLITIYSLGSSLHTGISEKISISPMKYQINVYNSKMKLTYSEPLDELSEDTINEMFKHIGANDVRLIYDSDLFIQDINNVPVEKSVEKISYVNIENKFLLQSEYDVLSQDSESFIGSMDFHSLENEAIVTKTFLMNQNIHADDIIGAKIKLSNEKNEVKQYEIIGVLYNEDDTILSQSQIYIPYDPKLANTEEFLRITYASFGLPTETDLLATADLISSYGYKYFTYLNNIENIYSQSKSFTIMGTLVGVLLLILASIGLTNSILVTINENKPFITYLRIIGLSRKKSGFIIVYTGTIQGMIGGLLGYASSYLFQNQIFELMAYVDIKLISLIQSFSIDPLACLYVFAYCIFISVISSLLSLFNVPKDVTINEMIND